MHRTEKNGNNRRGKMKKSVALLTAGLLCAGVGTAGWVVTTSFSSKADTPLSSAPGVNFQTDETGAVYLVENDAQLTALMQAGAVETVNKRFRLANDITIPGTLSNYSTGVFAGSLDGDGHIITINHFDIAANDEQENAVARGVLFDTLTQTGSITNLVVSVANDSKYERTSQATFSVDSSKDKAPEYDTANPEWQGTAAQKVYAVVRTEDNTILGSYDTDAEAQTAAATDDGQGAKTVKELYKRSALINGIKSVFYTSATQTQQDAFGIICGSVAGSISQVYLKGGDVTVSSVTGTGHSEMINYKVDRVDDYYYSFETYQPSLKAELSASNNSLEVNAIDPKNSEIIWEKALDVSLVVTPVPDGGKYLYTYEMDLKNETSSSNAEYADLVIAGLGDWYTKDAEGNKTSFDGSLANGKTLILYKEVQQTSVAAEETQITSVTETHTNTQQALTMTLDSSHTNATDGPISATYIQPVIQQSHEYIVTAVLENESTSAIQIENFNGSTGEWYIDQACTTTSVKATGCSIPGKSLENGKITLYSKYDTFADSQNAKLVINAPKVPYTSGDLKVDKDVAEALTHSANGESAPSAAVTASLTNEDGEKENLDIAVSLTATKLYGKIEYELSIKNTSTINIDLATAAFKTAGWKEKGADGTLSDIGTEAFDITSGTTKKLYKVLNWSTSTIPTVNLSDASITTTNYENVKYDATVYYNNTTQVSSKLDTSGSGAYETSTTTTTAITNGCPVVVAEHVKITGVMGIHYHELKLVNNSNTDIQITFSDSSNWSVGLKEASPSSGCTVKAGNPVYIYGKIAQVHDFSYSLTVNGVKYIAEVLNNNTYNPTYTANTNPSTTETLPLAITLTETPEYFQDYVYKLTISNTDSNWGKDIVLSGFGGDITNWYKYDTVNDKISNTEIAGSYILHFNDSVTFGMVVKEVGVNKERPSKIQFDYLCGTTKFNWSANRTTNDWIVTHKVADDNTSVKNLTISNVTETVNTPTEADKAYKQDYTYTFVLTTNQTSSYLYQPPTTQTIDGKEYKVEWYATRAKVGSYQALNNKYINSGVHVFNNAPVTLKAVFKDATESVNKIYFTGYNNGAYLQKADDGTWSLVNQLNSGQIQLKDNATVSALNEGIASVYTYDFTLTNSTGTNWKFDKPNDGGTWYYYNGGNKKALNSELSLANGSEQHFVVSYPTQMTEIEIGTNSDMRVLTKVSGNTWSITKKDNESQLSLASGATGVTETQHYIYRFTISNPAGNATKIVRIPQEGTWKASGSTKTNGEAIIIAGGSSVAFEGDYPSASVLSSILMGSVTLNINTTDKTITSLTDSSTYDFTITNTSSRDRTITIPNDGFWYVNGSASAQSVGAMNLTAGSSTSFRVEYATAKNSINLGTTDGTASISIAGNKLTLSDTKANGENLVLGYKYEFTVLNMDTAQTITIPSEGEWCIGGNAVASGATSTITGGTASDPGATTISVTYPTKVSGAKEISLTSDNSVKVTLNSGSREGLVQITGSNLSVGYEYSFDLTSRTADNHDFVVPSEGYWVVNSTPQSAGAQVSISNSVSTNVKVTYPTKAAKTIYLNGDSNQTSDILNIAADGSLTLTSGSNFTFAHTYTYTFALANNTSSVISFEVPTGGTWKVNGAVVTTTVSVPSGIKSDISVEYNSDQKGKNLLNSVNDSDNNNLIIAVDGSNNITLSGDTKLFIPLYQYVFTITNTDVDNAAADLAYTANDRTITIPNAGLWKVEGSFVAPSSTVVIAKGNGSKKFTILSKSDKIENKELINTVNGGGTQTNITLQYNNTNWTVSMTGDTKLIGAMVADESQVLAVPSVNVVYTDTAAATISTTGGQIAYGNLSYNNVATNRYVSCAIDGATKSIDAQYVYGFTIQNESTTSSRQLQGVDTAWSPNGTVTIAPGGNQSFTRAFTAQQTSLSLDSNDKLLKLTKSGSDWTLVDLEINAQNAAVSIKSNTVSEDIQTKKILYSTTYTHTYSFTVTKPKTAGGAFYENNTVTLDVPVAYGQNGTTALSSLKWKVGDNAKTTSFSMENDSVTFTAEQKQVVIEGGALTPSNEILRNVKLSYNMDLVNHSGATVAPVIAQGSSFVWGDTVNPTWSYDTDTDIADKTNAIKPISAGYNGTSTVSETIVDGDIRFYNYVLSLKNTGATNQSVSITSGLTGWKKNDAQGDAYETFTIPDGQTVSLKKQVLAKTGPRLDGSGNANKLIIKATVSNVSVTRKAPSLFINQSVANENVHTGYRLDGTITNNSSSAYLLTGLDGWTVKEGDTVVDPSTVGITAKVGQVAGKWTISREFADKTNYVNDIPELNVKVENQLERFVREVQLTPAVGNQGIATVASATYKTSFFTATVTPPQPYYTTSMTITPTCSDTMPARNLVLEGLSNDWVLKGTVPLGVSLVDNGGSGKKLVISQDVVAGVVTPNKIEMELTIQSSSAPVVTMNGVYTKITTVLHDTVPVIKQKLYDTADDAANPVAPGTPADPATPGTPADPNLLKMTKVNDGSQEPLLSAQPKAAENSTSYSYKYTISAENKLTSENRDIILSGISVKGKNQYNTFTDWGESSNQVTLTRGVQKNWSIMLDNVAYEIELTGKVDSIKDHIHIEEPNQIVIGSENVQIDDEHKLNESIAQVQGSFDLNAGAIAGRITGGSLREAKVALNFGSDAFNERYNIGLIAGSQDGDRVSDTYILGNRKIGNALTKVYIGNDEDLVPTGSDSEELIAAAPSEKWKQFNKLNADMTISTGFDLAWLVKDVTLGMETDKDVKLSLDGTAGNITVNTGRDNLQTACIMYTARRSMSDSSEESTYITDSVTADGKMTMTLGQSAFTKILSFYAEDEIYHYQYGNGLLDQTQQMYPYEQNVAVNPYSQSTLDAAKWCTISRPDPALPQDMLVFSFPNQASGVLYYDTDMLENELPTAEKELTLTAGKASMLYNGTTAKYKVTPVVNNHIYPTVETQTISSAMCQPLAGPDQIFRVAFFDANGDANENVLVKTGDTLMANTDLTVVKLDENGNDVTQYYNYKYILGTDIPTDEQWASAPEYEGRIPVSEELIGKEVFLFIRAEKDNYESQVYTYGSYFVFGDAAVMAKTYTMMDRSAEAGAIVLEGDLVELKANALPEGAVLEYLFTNVAYTTIAQMGDLNWTAYSGGMISLSQDKGTILYARIKYADGQYSKLFSWTYVFGTATAATKVSPATGYAVNGAVGATVLDGNTSISFEATTAGADVYYMESTSDSATIKLTRVTSLPSGVTESGKVVGGKLYIQLGDRWYATEQTELKKYTEDLLPSNNTETDRLFYLYAISLMPDYEPGVSSGYAYVVSALEKISAPEASLVTRYAPGGENLDITAVNLGDTLSFYSNTAGVSFVYSTDDGNTWLDVPSGGVVVDGEYGQNFVVRVKAVKEGMQDSNVVVFTYRIGDQEIAKAPTSTPATSNEKMAEVIPGSKILLSTATEGASIYFTTNGTTPQVTKAEDGTFVPAEGTYLYNPAEGIIMPNDGEEYFTIRAIAVRSDLKDSPESILSFAYPAEVGAPYANIPAGAVAIGTNILLRNLTEDATIFYTITTDGTEPADPDAACTVFTETSPIVVNTTTIVKAIAIKDGVKSKISRFEYTAKAKLNPPTASLASGSVVTSGMVLKLSAQEGTTIYYTLDGSDPTELGNTAVVSGDTITLSGAAGDMITIKAYASAPNGSDSEVAAFTYQITSRVAGVTADIPSGSAVSAGAVVNLLTDVSGASIYYTTNGNDPVTGGTCGSSVTITGEPGTTVTVKAAAVVGGQAGAVATFLYRIKDMVAAPVASPGSITISTAIKVELSAANGVSIFYTTDGSVPTASSNAYTEPIVINRETTLKAIAISADGEISSVASFRYKVASQAEAPKATVEDNTVIEPGTNVKLSTATSKADIYYTLDGSVPTIEQIKGTEAAEYLVKYNAETGIELSRSVSLHAVAYREDLLISDVANYTYIVETIPAAQQKEAQKEAQENAGLHDSDTSKLDREDNKEQTSSTFVTVKAAESAVGDTIERSVKRMYGEDYTVLGNYQVACLDDKRQTLPEKQTIELPLPDGYEDAKLIVTSVESGSNKLHTVNTWRQNGALYASIDSLGEYCIVGVEHSDDARKTIDPLVILQWVAGIIGSIGAIVFLFIKIKGLIRRVKDYRARR